MTPCRCSKCLREETDAVWRQVGERLLAVAPAHAAIALAVAGRWNFRSMKPKP